MSIAILLSTYNGNRFLREQLESILKQTVIHEITLFVRDDGSTDKTIEILEEYSKKIKCVIKKEINIGPKKSFWEMLMDESINADYYAFCDQDDIWDEDKLEKGMKILEEKKGKPALWCSNCRLIDENNNVFMKRMNQSPPELSICSQLVCGSIQGCAMLFNDSLRRYIVKKNVSFFPMHDFVLLTYAIAIGDVIYDDRPSFSYRMHSANVVAKDKKNWFKKTCNSLYMWFSKEHRHEISKYAQILYQDNREWIDNETKNYIKEIVNCRYSFASRLRIITSSFTRSSNIRALRSFKIRVLLGII